VPRRRDEVDLGPTGLLRGLTREVGLVPGAPLGDVQDVGDHPDRGAVRTGHRVDRYDQVERASIGVVQRRFVRGPAVSNSSPRRAPVSSSAVRPSSYRNASLVLLTVPWIRLEAAEGIGDAGGSRT
jgi:hypothetical protein